MGNHNQWTMLLKHVHANTGVQVSELPSLETRFATLAVSKKRSEGLLNIILDKAHLELKPKLQHMTPVNHSEVGRMYNGGLTARTINTSRYLWGGGSVVFERKRDLEVGAIRPYSTKTPAETLSWRDTKVVTRLESL